MKKIYKITGMLMMCAALSAPIMTSCSDDITTPSSKKEA